MCGDIAIQPAKRRVQNRAGKQRSATKRKRVSDGGRDVTKRMAFSNRRGADDVSTVLSAHDSDICTNRKRWPSCILTHLRHPQQRSTS